MLPLNVLGCISQDGQSYNAILGYPAIKRARVYIPGLLELNDILGYPAIRCAMVYIPVRSELHCHPGISCHRVYIPGLSELHDITLSGFGTEHCTTGQDSSSPPCKNPVNRSSSIEGYALSVGVDRKMTAHAETCCSVRSDIYLSPCIVSWGWSDKMVVEH